MQGLLFCVLFTACAARVVINELMYNHIMGERYEYVELHNTADTSINISGWQVNGINFTIPASTNLAANDFIVIVANKTAFMRYYDVASSKVIGDFAPDGNLADGGETVSLLTQNGARVSSVSYNDRFPWPIMPDGGGPSLELRCETADLDDPYSWISSPPSVDIDPHKETLGTPTAPNTYISCPAEKPTLPKVIFTEVMYKPVREQKDIDSHEFVEIYNADSVTVNIGNFRFVTARGMARFTFTGVSETLAPGEYAIIAKDPVAFAAQYPAATATVFGPFTGGLGNGGDKMALLSDNGHVVDSLLYDDKFPWPIAADGLGVDNDMLEYAGDPPQFADWQGVTYENFRYTGMSLQIRNRDVGDNGDHLSRWDVGIPTPGAATASFNTGNNAAATYVPVVKDIKLNGNDYPGGLLLDSQDVVLEIEFTPKISDLEVPLEFRDVRVGYINVDPMFSDIVYGGTGAVTQATTLQAVDFALAANGYTVDSDRLKASTTAGASKATYTFNLTPGEYVLELQPVTESDGQCPFRVFLNGNLLDSWIAPLGLSGFDYSTGRHTVATRTFATNDVIRIESDTVVTDAGTAFGRVYQLIFTPTANSNNGLTYVPCTAQASPSSSFTCTIPQQAKESVVRYQIEYRMRDQVTPNEWYLSPRPTDPFRYHAYFIDPELNTPTPTFHIYIHPDRWAQLQSEAELRRCNGATPRYDTWGHKVPAVVVHDGVVVDALLRFQGSRYNRPNGVTLPRTGYNFPPSTGAFKAISWRIAYPPYSFYKGGSVVILQKMFQGCTMFQTPLVYNLISAAGSPTTTTRYVRTHVNGQYFRYQIQVERGGSALVDRWNSDINDRCIDHPSEVVGDLYKAQGCGCAECTYWSCHAHPMPAQNGFTSRQVLAASCGKKTHRVDDENGHIPLENLFAGLAAQDLDNAPFDDCRAFLDANIDLQKVMTWMGVYNFGQAWDDNLHNWYPYQRATDGKWIVLPWDADRMFGESHKNGDGDWSQTRSMYIGEDGDRSTVQTPWHNRIKATILRCHKALFDQKVHQLLNTVLATSHTLPLLDSIYASFNQTEANDSWGSWSQDFPDCYARLKLNLESRPAYARTQLDDAQVGNPTLAEDDFCFNTPKITSRASNAYTARPGRPLALHVVSATHNRIVLSWTAPNPNGQTLVSYSVSRRPLSGGTWATVGTVPASTVNQPTFEDTGLAAAVVYRYRIRVLATQFSAWSFLTAATAKQGAVHQVPVVVNEVRANSGVENDFVELHNPSTNNAADVSGWYITDNLNDVASSFYKIPDNTQIPSGGYLVFAESQLGFRFSSAGEEVYVRRMVDDVYAGYTHGFVFDGSEEGRSLGRNVLSTGEEVLLQEQSVTPNAENAGALVGPVVIAEVMYAPQAPSITEYVVIQNVGSAQTPLHKVGNTTEPWRMGGLGGFRFPDNVKLAANEKAYLTNIDVAAFRTELGLPGSAKVYMFEGSLEDFGERVTLYKVSDDVDNVLAAIDWLEYKPTTPWPTAAAGNGERLVRLAATAKDKSFAIGPEPLNWGVAAASCSNSCENGGVCVRDDMCDCTDTTYTGATCEAPPLSCGDGTVQAASGEECDGGACCEGCKFKSAGAECRAAVPGGCDVAEQCTGSSGACPTDSFAALGLVCRPAAPGGCDVEETCTGASATCPANNFKPNTVVCRPKVPNSCDKVEFCPGNGAACPADAFADDTQVCRPAVGPCDEAETCTGSSINCPADSFKAAGVVCGASAGPCDLEETCSGTSAACPDDQVKANGVKCRDANGVCDLASQCDGTATSCPVNQFRPDTRKCRDRDPMNACDVDEFCTGVTADCPPDAPPAAGTPCDDGDTCTTTTTCSAIGICTGASDACECTNNSDCNDGNPCTVDTCEAAMPNGRECVFTPGNMGAPCRVAAGPCDVAETCDGNNAACPTNAFRGTDTECRSAAGVCALPAMCSGNRASCPSNPLRDTSFECRAASDTVCDAAEFCDGSSVDCPPDVALPNGTACDDENTCTSASTCGGLGNCSGARDSCECDGDGDCDDGNPCTIDKCENLMPFGRACTATPGNSGMECRAVTGPCDVAEQCDGTNAACPADVFRGENFVCRAASDLCESDSTCTGSSASCPANAVKPATVECRPVDGSKLCDAAEFCDGVGTACPADAADPAPTTPCDDMDDCTSASFCVGNGLCNGNRDQCACTVGMDDQCDDSNPCTVDRCVSLGASGTRCESTPGNAGTPCRTVAGVCDAEETCDGTNAACPADAFLDNSVECRAAEDVCDDAAMCTGSSASCPPNPFKAATVECRAADANDVCDAPEMCSGASKECPPNQRRPAGFACDDDNDCTSTSACTSVGVCFGQRDQCACDVDTDCNDNNPCTVDTCAAKAGGGRECRNVAGNQGAMCRASAGPCDVPEMCDGVNAQCPDNAFAPTSQECGTAEDVCDVAAKCSGTTASCPPNTFKPDTVECRPAAAVLCDAAEFCTGSSKECPPDAPAQLGTPCDDSDDCTSQSSCQGLGQCTGPRDSCACETDDDCDDRNPCSVDTCVRLQAPMTGRKCVYTPTELSAGAECRPSRGDCDEAEFCTGLSLDCPIDSFKANVVCRNSTQAICDVSERCTGKSPFCPADGFAGSEKVCRGAASLCDKPETCDGTSAECPPDLKQEFGHVCRESQSSCDGEEICDGISTTCPEDSILPDGEQCDDQDVCTETSVCLSGECVGSRSVCNCMNDADCDDGNDCTADKCVSLECKYEFQEPGERCNDGDPCSLNDRCTDGGRCQGQAFCENDSTCLSPGPFCQCSAGFGGLRCEKPLCDPIDLCGDGGVCILGNKCECLENYEGERCETYTGPDRGGMVVPPIRRLEDVDRLNFRNFSVEQDIGGGLKGWHLILIASSFLLLCLISLGVVGFLLKHFIVDPVDATMDDVYM